MPQPPSSSLTFNANLHGLRGIAALSVLLFHWGSDIGFFPQARDHLRLDVLGTTWDMGMLLDVGWLGVPLFFVLSGYLLTSQLLQRELNGPTIRHFWLRRGLRIYPAYWLQLLVLLALASVLPFMPQAGSDGDLLRHALLWLNLPPAMTSPMNAVWWTLPIELCFYLLLPALVLCARHISWQAVVACAALVTLYWRYQVMDYYSGENYSLHLAVLDAIPGTLFTFCAGFALAYLTHRRRPMDPTRRGLLLLVACIAFYAMIAWLRASLDTYWTGHWMLGMWNPLMAVVICAIMAALLQPLGGFAWLAGKVLVWLGDISYGIYLWHYPVLMLLQRSVLQTWDSPLQAVLALPISLACTLVLASMSYYLLEKPLMDRRWGKP